jgi:predicted outer membrane lipoprotein
MSIFELGFSLGFVAACVVFAVTAAVALELQERRGGR